MSQKLQPKYRPQLTFNELLYAKNTFETIRNSKIFSTMQEQDTVNSLYKIFARAVLLADTGSNPAYVPVALEDRKIVSLEQKLGIFGETEQLDITNSSFGVSTAPTDYEKTVASWNGSKAAEMKFNIDSNLAAGFPVGPEIYAEYEALLATEAKENSNE